MDEFNFKINSNRKISKAFLSIGIPDFREAMFFVKNLPYGRNSSKLNLNLVLSENKGTCSSKHALLKELALENQQNEVKLMMGIFKMNGKNTSKVKNTLEQFQLDYIPEAHNYLKINNKIYDCTTKKASEINFINDLIIEIEIQFDQITEFKIDYHKNFLKKWIQDKPFTLEEIWNIRELCISSLSDPAS